MNPNALFERYRELQQYVGWTEGSVERIRTLKDLVEPHFKELVDDFYEEIQKHPGALKVITGGQPQIERLKGTLIQWLHELLAGPYDRDYVARRWKVGYRHVEIGLDQVYTSVALSRLRRGIHHYVEQNWSGDKGDLLKSRNAMNMLLDLDLAIIQDAYQTEFSDRQQQAERLAAIGQVAGGIAHELRNPLNVIKTSVYYLVNAKNPSPEKVAEHLGRIEKQVGLSDRVITALSNFAKLPIPNMQPFAVDGFLREVVQESPLPKDVDLEIECPPSIPNAVGDPSQLHIVLRNLIRNAQDAMPNGGKLKIVATNSDGHVEIAVSDTGTGIDAENLHRIMQPLFSTKARGIGLGLAMARSIAQKNEGALTVESIPGHGATFTIQLKADGGDNKIDP